MIAIFSGKNRGVTPSVAAPSITHPSDATAGSSSYIHGPQSTVDTNTSFLINVYDRYQYIPEPSQSCMLTIFDHHITHHKQKHITLGISHFPWPLSNFQTCPQFSRWVATLCHNIFRFQYAETCNLSKQNPVSIQQQSEKDGNSGIAGGLHLPTFTFTFEAVSLAAQH